MIDVLSSSRYLRPVLIAIELSQLIVQAMWPKDSPLLQIPHFTAEMVDRCKSHDGNPVTGVFDILDLEDDERNALLQISPAQMAEVADFCNAYPIVEAETQIRGGAGQSFSAGSEILLDIHLQRVQDDDDDDDDDDDNMDDNDDDDDVDLSVRAARFPAEKVETWYLVVGEASGENLLALKRVKVEKETNVTLSFDMPGSALPDSDVSLTLFLLCDSYVGCDLEYPITVRCGK